MSKPLTYRVLYFISCLISLLPYRFVCFLGQRLGMLFYKLSARHRSRAISQCEQHLRVSHRQAARIVSRLFSRLGQTVAEFLYYPALTKDKLHNIVMLEGQEYLQQALAHGRGVALLCAHFGNWELMGAALARYGYPCTTLVKPQHDPVVDRFINDYRMMMGMEITTKGLGVKETLKALRRNRIVGFFVDQDAWLHGIFVDFLGQSCATPTGPAAIARKFGCPVVPCFIIHRPQGGHTIVVEPPLQLVCSEDERQDVQSNTVMMNQVIERYVRRYPDEWLWFQKRWQTRPKAEDPGQNSQQ